MKSNSDGSLMSFTGLNNLLRTFSPFERMLLYGFSILLALTSFILLVQANDALTTRLPARGGSFTEGAAGTARFLNPLLATTQADQDLTTLVYSGLVRELPDGSITPDIAEWYEISDDSTIYTFHLRQNATFHDGTPLTAEDVAFTVALAQTPDIKSVRRADWEGVVVHIDDEHTITFTLPNAYAPFLRNTTLGILPKHLWETVPVEEFPFAPLNTHPIGSGPFMIKNATFDTTGAPTEYILASFANFTLGEPNLENITYRIYPNEEALIGAFEKGAVQSFLSLSPKTLPEIIASHTQLIDVPLSRVFAVFFNQNHSSVLTNAAARTALRTVVDTQAIVNTVLGGYGSALTGPIPPGLIPEMQSTSTEATATTTEPTEGEQVSLVEEARNILERGGWEYEAPEAASTTDDTTLPAEGRWVQGKEKTPLSLSLATADTDELVMTANAVADAWRALGANVNVEIYPLTEFNQQILRPRAYDAVLFGEVVGRSLDLFAFWHSSQRNDPGLNLALYTNTTADKILADARAQSDFTKRIELYDELLEEIEADTPAVFLYTPHIAYVAPTNIHGLTLGTLTTPAERFLNVYEWYRDTERVWEIFAN